MILVNCQWRQEHIIREIESIKLEDIQVFKHVKTEGMRIYFDSRIEDQSANIDKDMFWQYNLIMGAIMKIPGWNALAISILPVVNNSIFQGYKYTLCRSNKCKDK